MNNIDVTQEDLNRAVVVEARRFPGQEREVVDHYKKNREALESLRAPVFEDKVVDYILELARVSERKVSLEDMLKAGNEDEALGDAEADAGKTKSAAKKKAGGEERIRRGERPQGAIEKIGGGHKKDKVTPY